ncbi:uncharacterized protein PRCAT00006138001 [Priceomyces carsonii]|uniref:uncharacterized protein n=1 Tax=Priceomyces carsonii TaxID=28549 RepID=UPI002EDA2191|nr:unnamed protein product [Priceomyces carsonii]
MPISRFIDAYRLKLKMYVQNYQSSMLSAHNGEILVINFKYPYKIVIRHSKMIHKLGLNTSAPYHLLFYSLVFGGTVSHSFILSPIAFKNLPRAEFGKLQNKVFPLYFIGQALSPLILGLSTPLKLCPFTIGLLSLSALGGVLNYFVLLPVCRNIKAETDKLLEDNKAFDSEGKPTETYDAVNKKFGKFHGFSMLFNLLSILSLGGYGVVLAKRLV